MKIGILTFHCADNYGAVLQTYGLQEYLKGFGHNVYVINYCPQSIVDYYKAFQWEWLPNRTAMYNLWLLIRAVWILPIRLKRKRRFRQFVNSHINLSSRDMAFADLSYDAFIFGSDQIWNPNLTAGLDDIYFGRFPAAKGKKLIAYAASAGSCKNLLPYANVLQSLILNFHAISVRERSLADYLQKITNNTIYVTVDPVLLAGRSIYSKLAHKKISRKPYLLSFQLVYNELQSLIAKEIAKEKGLNVIELSSLESLKQCKLLVAESPESFLSLFLEASYVVTSSFHGTVFAILFEKDFNTVSLDAMQSERMSDLLRSLNLYDRLVIDGNQPTTASIDFNVLNKRLDELRASSQMFIKEALR